MAKRLTSDERARIEAHRAAGATAGDIAELIGRHRSTVYRELSRGGGLDGVYRAQSVAAARARRPRAAKLEAGSGLARGVRGRLKRGWSPRSISADLAALGQQVRAETICRAAYSGRGLGADAWKDLPRRRRRRRPRSRHAPKAGPLGEYRPLCERPVAAGDRSEPGHWEGDLIAAAVTEALARRPDRLLRTPAWDQGRETARWADIEAELGIEVFFCDPHSPWQRPTNEHANGLLRRWCPKGTPLGLNPLRLSIIEDNLNWMPRRGHRWRSAADICTQLSRNHR